MATPIIKNMISQVTDPEFLLILKVLLRQSQLLYSSDKKQPAVVFDIDGTLVHDNTWDSPIWSVINFCNHCKEIGFSTIIVTARPGWEHNMESTKNSLQKLGLRCDSFFFRHPDYKDLDQFKTQTREFISTDKNYKILMSIGDNEWDIGQYGGLGVLMKTNQYTNAISYEIRP